jgi:hypothetical protein
MAMESRLHYSRCLCDRHAATSTVVGVYYYHTYFIMLGGLSDPVEASEECRDRG